MAGVVARTLPLKIR